MNSNSIGNHDKHRISKKTKLRGTQSQQKTVDYGQNLQSKSSSDNDDKRATKKKSRHGSTRPKQLATSDVDVNAVPNPAPDTGVTHTYIYYTQTAVHTGILPAVPTSTSGFSPLPPLASFGTTGVVSYSSAALTSLYYTPSSLPSSNLPETTAQASVASNPKRLPLVEIVAIAVGSALVFFGILAAAWSCTRPRKRTHPVPSLPILQEDYVEPKEEADEESLFGGKERTSARPGSGGVLWTWTQYPHVSMSNKLGPKVETTTAQSVASNKRASTVLGEKTGYPFGGHGVTAQHNPSPGTPLQQQLQSALNKAANRVSAMSVSIYPTSPQTNAGYTDIGIALTGGVSPDDDDRLKRNDSKSGKRRSVAAHGRTAEDLAAGNVYQGSSLTVPKTTHGGGRMPVKGPYAPTASMRSSASLSRVPSASRRSMANPFEASQYALPSQSAIIKSDGRRERDTQALTSALGLASPPPPPSPQTTIHPDDSITLAGDRRHSRNLGHSRQRSSFMSPTMEASARLGNLMLTEFQSMNSLPSSRAIPQASVTANKNRAPPVRKKTDDKPPRVPSPPPLPSLAQMALAHANPGEYGDYRSPTYSIYGLYEADRKSRTPGDGSY